MQTSSDEIARAYAKQYHCDYLDLSHYHSKNIPWQLIDNKLLSQHVIAPLRQQDTQLYIAIAQPDDRELLDNIRFQSNCDIKPVFVAYDKLLQIINEHISKQIYAKSHNLTDNAIVSLVNQLLTDASVRNASDIHIEPLREHCRIRMRIDGLLHHICQLPRECITNIIGRLKIMAELDISEHRVPQDGRFYFQGNYGIQRDCRLSICPGQHGEKAVIRLLNNHKRVLSIEELGLCSNDQQQFIQAIHKPQGLILVTGPTGSGKTLTLYTALSMVNDACKNISTIEDPIEIQLHGIHQVNVSHKTGLNFATVMRAFLRQDPDIIMVGEIRDTETATMAIRAAQTGHLVFATLHTNGAKQCATRLENLGIASFNIQQALNCVIAQRLCRKLCQHCKQPQQSTHPALANHTIYTAVGCQHCLDGYRGRIGVFELLIGNSLSQSLWQDALQKVKDGLTSLEEIYRVVEKDT